VTIGSPATAAVSNPPTTTPPTTTPPAAATPGKLTAPKPKITGQAKVGKTLAAKAGAWTKGTKLTYHWSANGKRIKGAVGAKLKLAKALKGKKISVEVTGTKGGYTTVTKESKQTGKVRR
jgi:heme-binding NEAT domain protein